MRVTVVGGGISGLAATHGLVARGHDVVLLDAGAAPGGLIASVRRDGFLCEHGPQAVLDGPEETRALIDAAGLSARVQQASPAARKRYVYVGGALRPFPASPPALFKTNLLSFGAKLRLFAEPFVARRAVDEDESVLAFVTRRFGREAAERAAAPALIGVFAGDAAALSLRSALPRVAAMEREHGSILRALRRRKPGSGLGRPISFPDGLEELPAALARALGDRRRAGRAAEIAPLAGGWRVVTETGGTIDSDRLVLATPAAATAALLSPHAPEAAAALRAIRHAPVAVVCLGFRAAAGAGAGMGVDLDAYGFVVARGEGIRLLGCQYETSVFADRAPAGGVLLRALLGGTFDPELVDADDGAIAAQAIADLERAAGLARPPDLVDVWRARPGIPQYDLGHAGRVRAVDDAVARLPGLAVIGHALRGVGVNDCIAAAARVTTAL